MTSFLEKIGPNIRKLRELRGYKQEYLAEQLGMSLSGFGKIERGETDVSIGRLEQVAKVLDIKIETILGFNENIVLQQITNNHAKFTNGVYIAALPEQEEERYKGEIILLKEQIAQLKQIVELQQNHIQ